MIFYNFNAFIFKLCATLLTKIVMDGDEGLNCEQLNNEIARLAEFISKAEKEKGVNWGNAGRLIVFPIGI